MELLAGNGWSRAGPLLAVTAMFGLINAILKPLIKSSAARSTSSRSAWPPL
jgi:hypothetical protein